MHAYKSCMCFKHIMTLLVPMMKVCVHFSTWVISWLQQPCTRHHHHDMMRYKRFQNCSTCSKLIVGPKFKCMKLMAMEQSCHALCSMFSLVVSQRWSRQKTATLGSVRECWQETATTEVKTTTLSHVFIDPSIHLGPTWCGCRSSKCICALQVGQCPTAPELCNFSSESSRVHGTKRHGNDHDTSG